MRLLGSSNARYVGSEMELLFLRITAAKYASTMGKGMGQKAADHCVAALCHTCHGDMDGYVGGNGDDRAARFMVAILKTQHALLREGVSIEARSED
jgi:hypothetical protein